MEALDLTAAKAQVDRRPGRGESTMGPECQGDPITAECFIARCLRNLLPLEDLNAQLGLLPGDCIVAAGMVSYVEPSTICSYQRREARDKTSKNLQALQFRVSMRKQSTASGRTVHVASPKRLRRTLEKRVGRAGNGPHKRQGPQAPQAPRAAEEQL